MTPAFLAPAAAFVRRHQLLPLTFLALLALILVVPKTQVYRNFFYIAVVPCFLLAHDRRLLAAIAESWVWRCCALLLAYMWLTLFWSATAEPEDFFNFARRVLSIQLYITILAMLAATPGFPQRLFRWLIAVAAAVAVAVLLIYAIHRVWDPRYRVGALGFANPNVTGAVYSVLLLGALFYLLKAKSTLVEWRLAVVAMAIMAFFVLLTQSRGNWIALAATLILIAMLAGVRWILVAIPISVAILGVCLALGMMDLHILLGRGDSYRVESWLHVFDIWRKAPWFGIGVDFNPIFHSADGSEIWHAHNVYLSYMAHGGAVALALYLLMLSAAAIAAFRAFVAEGNFGVIGMLLFIALYSIIDFEIFTLNAGWQWLFVWLPIGLVIGTQVRPTAAVAEPASGSPHVVR
ncbi:MAG: O-antigen ligase family protein [Xanthobacteraceae bacterium]